MCRRLHIPLLSTSHRLGLIFAFDKPCLFFSTFFHFPFTGSFCYFAYPNLRRHGFDAPENRGIASPLGFLLSHLVVLSLHSLPFPSTVPFPLAWKHNRSPVPGLPQSFNCLNRSGHAGTESYSSLTRNVKHRETNRPIKLFPPPPFLFAQTDIRP